MIKRTFEIEVIQQSFDHFQRLKGRNVLFYWPHGLGDFVFLSYILPLLDPSNRYFVTRFGDDNSALFEGGNNVQPLYIGHNSVDCGDGAIFACEHLGLRREATTDGPRKVTMPAALHDACIRNQIDVLADLPFPEVWGEQPFPYHTKARSMARNLLSAERLAQIEFSKPLASCLTFDVPKIITSWVEARLRNLTGWTGRKLCLLARNGYTTIGKNWGHLWREELPVGKQREGEECRDFMRLLLREDPEWTFMALEDRLHLGDDTVSGKAFRCTSFAALIGEQNRVGIPFGLTIKALMNIADLVVGVPTGPYHLAMSKPGLPVVGVWTEQLPSWYDEPKAESIHLVGRGLAESAALKRPGSFSEYGELTFALRELDTRIVPGEAVLSATLDLLKLPSKPAPRHAITRRSKPSHGEALIAVTIGVGRKHQRMASLAVETCRARTGLPTFILGDEALRRYELATPHFLKLKLFAEFPDADSILYFDADTLFLQNWDVRETAGTRKLAGCIDHWNLPWIIEDARLIGIPPKEYINTGLMLLHREPHEGMLELAMQLTGEFSGGHFEQTMINCARSRLDLPMHVLDRRFNHLDFELTSPSPEVVVAHFSGIGGRDLENIEQTYRYWIKQPLSSTSSRSEAIPHPMEFEYERVGYDRRRLVLEPNGTIGSGAAGCERRWGIVRENGSKILWIVGDAHPTCALKQAKDGSWRGRWLRHEQMPIRLTPVNGAAL